MDHHRHFFKIEVFNHRELGLQNRHLTVFADSMKEAWDSLKRPDGARLGGMTQGCYHLCHTRLG